jgi:polyisoprenoid-binding protein YceI
MRFEPGKHAFGPDNGTLTVHTGKGGAASKAGHNLRIEVTKWAATLEGGAQPAIELTADAKSLRVREGTGGVQSLGDDDKAGIDQTIDEEVLKGGAIRFHSTGVEVSSNGRRMEVAGELELLGRRAPIDFSLRVDDDGHITGSAVIRQTDFKMKPYSALFGTLKVLDEVEIAVDARVPAAVHAQATPTGSEQHG